MSGHHPGDIIRCPTNGHVYELVKVLRECRCGAVWFAVRAKPAGEVVLKVIDKVCNGSACMHVCGLHGRAPGVSPAQPELPCAVA